MKKSCGKKIFLFPTNLVFHQQKVSHTDAKYTRPNKKSWYNSASPPTPPPSLAPPPPANSPDTPSQSTDTDDWISPAPPYGPHYSVSSTVAHSKSSHSPRSPVSAKSVWTEWSPGAHGRLYRRRRRRGSLCRVLGRWCLRGGRGRRPVRWWSSKRLLCRPSCRVHQVQSVAKIRLAWWFYCVWGVLQKFLGLIPWSSV